MKGFLNKKELQTHLKKWKKQKEKRQLALEAQIKAEIKEEKRIEEEKKDISFKKIKEELSVIRKGKVSYTLDELNKKTKKGQLALEQNEELKEQERLAKQKRLRDERLAEAKKMKKREGLPKKKLTIRS